jgi:hypothetical protein
MTSLLFGGSRLCGWCLTEPATTIKYATASCFTCAAGDAKLRISRWLDAIRERQQKVRFR